MNTKRLISISLLALMAALVLSACSGRRTVSTNWHGLAADAERAYLSDGTFIYAIDLQTHQKVWQYPTEADAKLMFYATPVLTEDGQLLVGSAGTNHPFISLDPKTGKEKWAESFTKNKGAWIASPLVFNNLIYAPNTDGFLYIMDMEGKQAADPIELGGALWSAPVTDGVKLYVASLDHHLHIIDISNPSQNKSVDLSDALPSSPALADGGVYIGSFASKVDFITPNGETKTIAKTDNWIWASPVLDGETLYYTDLSGNIVSFNLAKNSINWSAPQSGDAIVAGLLVYNERIYVATESGKVLVFDKDGKQIAQDTIAAKLYTTPVASGDLILIAPYQAEFVLAAYDTDGRQVWTFTPEK